MDIYHVGYRDRSLARALALITYQKLGLSGRSIYHLGNWCWFFVSSFEQFVFDKPYSKDGEHNGENQGVRFLSFQS